MRAALSLLLAVLATGAVETAQLQPLLGEVERFLIEEQDTLLDVAYRHRLGYEAVARMNPEVDPWIPPPGSVVRLPTQYVLPDVELEGLVINVPEMRLYDFSVDPGPEVFAVAVGDREDPTLLGSFRVGRKRRSPAWTVPASIRAERPELPSVVPPGPENPLGDHWMTIGRTSYGIHGTNIRWSIGRTATHGCVRLYESEMARLFERTSEGTPLRLVYQPYKWGRDGDALYLEAHPDLYGEVADPWHAALQVPREAGLLGALDLGRVRRVLEQARGIPVVVGRIPSESGEVRPIW